MYITYACSNILKINGVLLLNIINCRLQVPNRIDISATAALSRLRCLRHTQTREWCLLGTNVF